MGWSFIDDYDDRYFMDYDLASLSMDNFYMKFNFSSEEFEDIFLYKLQRECTECPYQSTHRQNLNYHFMTDIFETNLQFRIASIDQEYIPLEEVDDVICDIDYGFKEFGVYSVDVNKTGCYVNILKEPVNIYTPILTVILIYLALYLLIYGICLIWKKYTSGKNTETNSENVGGPQKERVQSLDTFRGITIVLMIFANFGCGGYEFIEHAKWNGLHLADLVFPSFMWIMGVCIPISLSSSFRKNIPNKTVMSNITKRSIKLFCLGIFLGSGINLKYLRVFGVLQRFAIAYFVVSTICLFFMERSDTHSKDKTPKILEDILKIWKGWIVALIFIIVHTVIIFTVAAPDCPKGYMGPGGLHKNQSYTECIGGATGYIDGLLLGNHRYQYPTIYAVYGSKPFEPEGVVGCLSTIFQVFLGVQAGLILLVHKEHMQRLIRWLLWAIATGLLGAGLCGFSKENGVIPVNKNLWSLSFVMVTSCVAFSLLSLCYFLVDVKKYWSGKPFLFAGMNAILMYIGHEMTGGCFPVSWYMDNELGNPRRTHFLALMSDTWSAGVWVLVSYYLYKIKYFFTI